VGEWGVLAKDLPVRCCNFGPILAGTRVNIWKQTSPNRALVGVPFDDSGAENLALHKVRLSSVWFEDE